MNEEDIKQQEEMEQMKKAVLKKVLDKSAIERMGRIRLVKPEVANQLELYLMQLYQSGKLKNVITEEQLIMILDSLSAKKQFKIIR
jgi:programmed cell death protein 5